jgi:hypothetical protein
MRRALVLLISFVAVACGGGSSSPTSPTPSASTQRGLLTVVSVDATSARTNDGGFQVTTTLRLRETGGLAVTVNSVTVQFLDAAGTGAGQAVFNTPISDASNRIAANGELSTRQLTATAPAGSPFPASVRATVAFTDDRQATGSVAGQANVPALPALPALGTVAGVVTDHNTRVPVPNILVAVDGGPYTGRSSVTDGNGYYSISGVQGSVVLRSSGTGYITSSRGVTVNGDTRLDFTVQPQGPPVPAVEYRVYGSRASLTYANAQEGTSQNSSAMLPWTYSFNSARTGQFLYISAQNTGDSGQIRVEIWKRGSLYRTSTSQGAFAIATASGSY